MTRPPLKWTGEVALADVARRYRESASKALRSKWDVSTNLKKTRRAGSIVGRASGPFRSLRPSLECDRCRELDCDMAGLAQVKTASSNLGL